MERVKGTRPDIKPSDLLRAITHEDNPQLRDGMNQDEAITLVLSHLTDREVLVIKMRFGIDAPIAYTLRRTGEIIGVTAARIRQIEAKALRKSRHPNRNFHWLENDETNKLMLLYRMGEAMENIRKVQITRAHRQC